MSQFAVIRHLETGGLGTAPAEAMDLYVGQGWVRVSEYRAEPSAFHLPDFADAPDLDAPEPEPEPEADTEQELDEAPAETTEESTE